MISPKQFNQGGHAVGQPLLWAMFHVRSHLSVLFTIGSAHTPALRIDAAEALSVATQRDRHLFPLAMCWRRVWAAMAAGIPRIVLGVFPAWQGIDAMGVVPGLWAGNKSGAFLNVISFLVT